MRWSRSRRLPLVVLITLLTLAVVGGTAAIGIASMGAPTDRIILTVDDGRARLDHGGTTQWAKGWPRCDVDTDKYGAGLMSIDGTSYDGSGSLVDPASIGIVHDGIGVNAEGKGKSRHCGRIDFDDTAGASETLTFTLGPALAGKMMTSVDLNIGAKYDAEILIEFLRRGAKVDEYTELLSNGSDSGPDSGDRDNYRVIAAPAGGEVFDAVRISTLSGSVSVEGDDDDHDGKSIFHLIEATTGIGVDALTNGVDDLGFVATGTPLTWTYLVTNEGDLPLTNVAVTDDQLGPVAGPPSGDTDGDGALDVGETWVYTATGSAGAGDYANTATVSGDSIAETATASDSSHYFGASPSLTLDASNNGSVPDGYIPTGDPVDWGYTVTNTGNVALTGISVSDEVNGAVGCGATTLDPGSATTCSATSTALTGAQSNMATASASGPAGIDPADQTATTSYFGSSPSLSISISNDGAGDPPVVTDPDVTWTVEATNDGNVPVTAIAGTEDGTSNTCTIGTLGVGESGSCTITVPTVEGSQSTGFTVTGDGPLGTPISVPSGSLGYFGGLACGEGLTSGGAGLADTPLGSLQIGPDNGTKLATPICAVAAVVTTDVSATEQSVGATPPAGYTWGGVTGVLTVEWDAEPASLAPLNRTLQRLSSGDVVIPWCADIVGIAPVGDGSYMLDPASALYPTATGGGDLCLITQMTRTVDLGGSVGIQTVEVFYLWNDPLLIRGR